MSQKGFAQPHLLVIPVALLILSALVPITRNYNDGVSNVAGVSLEKNSVKVVTAPDQIAIVDKKVGALTNYPYTVDSNSGQITVTTPAGEKKVATSPQKAVDNMLAAHIMDYVTSEKVKNNLASIENLVKLDTKDKVLVYRVKGKKTHKVLGVVPVKTGVEAVISAENGQVVESKTSLLARVLNKVSP